MKDLFKKIILISSFLFLCTLLSFAMIQEENSLIFSLESGIYDNNTVLELDTTVGGKVYYTLNGGKPNPGDEGTYEYSEPITLNQKNNAPAMYSISAITKFGGKVSKPIYKNYYINNHSENTEQDIYYISINIDPDELFNYNDGIFIKGKAYDDWVASGGDINSPLAYIYGNFRSKTKKNSFVTFLDNNGQLLFEDDTYMQIAGSSSRAYACKSLKLSTIEYNTKFVFDEMKMDSIKLRVGGQDISETGIRYGIVSKLVQDSGYDMSGNKYAIVYMNGKPYYVVNVMDDYSEYNLASKYDLLEEYIEIVDVIKVYTDFDMELETLYGQEYGYDQIIRQDLNSVENRKQLEKIVDMDDYLKYNAIQILINNLDWRGNWSAWRYKLKENAGNKYADGRVRFLIYDIDFAYWSSASRGGDAFDDAMIKSDYFSNVMNSSYYRRKFINILCDLINTSFTTENIISVVEENDQLYSTLLREISVNEYNDTLQSGDWISQVKELRSISVANMKTEILERPDEIKQKIQDWFGYYDSYTLEIANPISDIHVNSLTIPGGNSFTGTYYRDVPIEIYADIKEDSSFSCWVVNGTKYYTEHLSLTSDMIGNNKVINLELHLNQENGNG